MLGEDDFTADLDDVEFTADHENRTHVDAHVDSMTAHADSMTAWAKDFAKDFRKNFSSLGTPPVAPTPPTPPTAPAPPERSGDDATTGTIPAQPWTWSTGSGTTPPAGPHTTTGEQPTTPIEQPSSGEAQDASPSEDTEADVERLRVLEALERGEIDIDEALARLDNDDAQGA